MAIASHGQEIASVLHAASSPCHKSFSWSSRPVAPRRRRGGLGFIISYCVLTRVGPVRSTTLTIPETRNRRSIPLTGLKMKLLVALWALAGTASGLLPVIVPLNDDANGTQWGPVTADISANRCRAFAVAFEGGKRCIIQMSIGRVVHPTHGLICTHRRQEAGDGRHRRGLEQGPQLRRGRRRSIQQQ